MPADFMAGYNEGNAGILSGEGLVFPPKAEVEFMNLFAAYS